MVDARREWEDARVVVHGEAVRFPAPDQGGYPGEGRAAEGQVGGFLGWGEVGESVLDVGDQGFGTHDAEEAGVGEDACSARDVGGGEKAEAFGGGGADLVELGGSVGACGEEL